MTTEILLLLVLACVGLLVLAIACIAPADEPSAPPAADAIPDDAWLEQQLAGLLDNHSENV